MTGAELVLEIDTSPWAGREGERRDAPLKPACTAVCESTLSQRKSGKVRQLQWCKEVPRVVGDACHSYGVRMRQEFVAPSHPNINATVREVALDLVESRIEEDFSEHLPSGCTAMVDTCCRGPTSAAIPAPLLRGSCTQSQLVGKRGRGSDQRRRRRLCRWVGRAWVCASPRRTRVRGWYTMGFEEGKRTARCSAPNSKLPSKVFGHQSARLFFIHGSSCSPGAPKRDRAIDKTADSFMWSLEESTEIDKQTGMQRVVISDFCFREGAELEDSVSHERLGDRLLESRICASKELANEPICFTSPPLMRDRAIINYPKRRGGEQGVETARTAHSEEASVPRDLQRAARTTVSGSVRKIGCRSWPRLGCCIVMLFDT